MVNTRSLLRNIFSRLFPRKNTESPSGEHLAFQQIRTLKNTRLPSPAQLRQLPHILSPKEKRIFRGSALLFSLGIFFILFGVLSSHLSTTPKRGGVLTEGMLGNPQLINPLYADANTVDKELTMLVYSGLLAYNPTTQTLEPHLAESMTLSEDEKIYTLVLREGVTWHDQEPLSMQDVLFTFSALQNSAYGSPLSSAYQGVTVSQRDERTVAFELQEPYAAFPELLTVGILPAHLWGEIAPAYARTVPLNLKPIGTGPYLLTKTSKDSRGVMRSVSLEAFDGFIGTKSYLESIVVKFYTTPQDILDALQTKRIDTTSSLSLNEALTLREDSALAITPLPISQYVGVFFNTKKTPLTEVSLRTALTRALNISQIAISATEGLAQPQSFTLPGFSPAEPPAQDQQAAVTLLEELGWVQNEQGKRAKDGKELALTITTAERPELIRTAEELARTWENLGMTITIRTLGSADMTTALQEKTYDILLAAEQYGIIADPYPFWHSTRKGADGLNMSQFSTPASDAAVTTLRTTSAQEKRQEAFAVLQQELSSAVPAAFLFQQVIPLVHTVDVLGISATPLPQSFYRWTLEPTWYKRTGIVWNF